MYKYFGKIGNTISEWTSVELVQNESEQISFTEH